MKEIRKKGKEFQEKMNKYNQAVKKREEDENEKITINMPKTKEEEEVITINAPKEEPEEVITINVPDENTITINAPEEFQKQEARLNPMEEAMLPKEIKQLFKKYPELATNPEIRQKIKKIVQEFLMKNPLEQLKENIKNTHDLIIQQVLIEQALKSKTPEQLKELKEAVEKIEEE